MATRGVVVAGAVHRAALPGARTLDLEGVNVPAGHAIRDSDASALEPSKSQRGPKEPRPFHSVEQPAGSCRGGAVLPGSDEHRRYAVRAGVPPSAGPGCGRQTADSANRPGCPVDDREDIVDTGRHLCTGPLPCAVCRYANQSRAGSALASAQVREGRRRGALARCGDRASGSQR